MTFDTLDRFPCGEFKPGYEPRPGPGVNNNQPSTFIPGPPNTGNAFLIPGNNRPTGGPDVPVPGIPTPPGPSPAGPKASGPAITSPPPTTGSTPTPGGGITGGTTTGGGPTAPTPYRPGDVTGGRGPITGRRTLIDVRYRCATQTNYCPPTGSETTPLVPSGTRSICVECSRGAGETISAWYTRCSFATAYQCATQCRSTQISPSPCITSPTTLGSTANRPLLPNTTTITSNNIITNSNIDSNTIRQTIDRKNISTIVINNKAFRGYANASSLFNNSSLFDPIYNFFKTDPDPNTKLVTNNLYLNIFSDIIPYEVSYFLTHIKGASPWNEKLINNLTNEKISISLNKQLLTSISNIHTVANKKVNDQVFFAAIKKHLLEGTIDEFDPNYYLYTYNTQLNDELIDYSETGETWNTFDSAFAIFENNSVSPDYLTSQQDPKQDEFKRMRFLLEDIEATVKVYEYEGIQSDLYLTNGGLPVITLEGYPYATTTIDTDIRLGDGAGYYFSTLTIEGDEYPFVSDHSLSDVGHLAPNSKYTNLNMLGKNGELRITVSSQVNNHEFNSNYNSSADLEIMYFAADMRSVQDIPNPNSVINILSATYRRLTNEEAINHSRNYSLNAVKINLDYRDPIIHYARDTSSLHLEQDDFDLRAFDVNRSIKSFRIMPRTIPAAIILVPGCGSYHNPYNGRSNIQQFNTSTVVRNLSLLPSNDSKDAFLDEPYLDKSNIYNETGKDYFGLFEKYYLRDNQSNIYTFNPSSNIFSKSYYYSGQYTNVQPPSSLRETSPESKLISLINKLTSVSGVNELTWWDVFRRLKLNDVASLVYINNAELTKQLSLGYSNNVPIKHVLSRWDLVYTGIPADAIIPDDNIYINIEDRRLNVS